MPTISCAQNLDDAQERDDTTGVVDGNEMLCADFGSFAVDAFARFDGWDIPSGVAITSAFLTVRCQASDDMDATLQAEDIDDAPAIAVANGNISGRTYTTASVQWVTSDLGDAQVNSPSIVSLIQELVDTYGGIAGAIGIRFLSNRNGLAANLEPFNQAGTLEPELTVVYTPPAFPHSQAVIIG